MEPAIPSLLMRLARRTVVLVVIVASVATLGCGRGQDAGGVARQPLTAPDPGPGPRGEVPPADQKMTAPSAVKAGEIFRIELHTPLHTRTAYVYWQKPDGENRWTTFGIATGAPGGVEEPVFLEYPLPEPFPVSTNAIFPDTATDPAFQDTIAPQSPGRYRILKALLVGDSREPVWVAHEITVTT